jgi:hypothetical protein
MPVAPFELADNGKVCGRHDPPAALAIFRFAAEVQIDQSVRQIARRVSVVVKLDGRVLGGRPKASVSRDPHPSFPVKRKQLPATIMQGGAA